MNARKDRIKRSAQTGDKLYRSAIDLKGQTFGKLIVIEYHHSNKNGVYWLCNCECGNQKVMNASDLRKRRKTTMVQASCGCAFIEQARRLASERKGPKSPRWIKNREYVVSHKVTKKFLYKQLQTLMSGRKTKRTHLIVGYTASDLVAHLEKKFDSNMSWANYGTYWHIDHILPVSYFTKRGIFDPVVVNALENLQPLEAIENIRKGNKVIINARTPNN